MTLERFFKLCTKKSEHDGTAGDTLYALYRRWEYLSSGVCVCGGEDCKRRHAVDRDKFDVELDKRAARSVFGELGQFTVFDLEVEFPEEKPSAPKKTEPSKFLHELVATRSLTFSGGLTIEPADVVRRFSASEPEKERLRAEWEKERERGELDASAWVVIHWEGRRRLVPGSAFERHEAT